MMTKVRGLLLKMAAPFRSEKGQGLAEYGLILALVSVALVAGLTALALGIAGVFDDVIAAF